MSYDYLIVGAGLFGSIFARELTDRGYTCLVIDKRNHIAGNCYTENVEGINIHKYGPHIFHTSDRRVMDFLSRFTDWVPYQHRVKCLGIRGDLYDFPPSAQILDSWKPDPVLDTFYRPYTAKMWNKDLQDVDPAVLDRVRRRDPKQIGYFADRYQCMPQHGYTAMVTAMLDHPRITVSLNTAWRLNLQKEYDTVFNSMSIDQYHGYCFGPLPYRSIRFRSWDVYGDPLCDVPVINFTSQPRYTIMSPGFNCIGISSPLIDLTHIAQL
jgi:UDP-galactopyranose mutase